MGCDLLRITDLEPQQYFNPRTHRGVRLRVLFCITIPLIFQSTHPSWGATKIMEKKAFIKVISIHAPIVGCDRVSTGDECSIIIISIHAPIVGCDIEDGYVAKNNLISIHAPIVGCDRSSK